jgi:hypothetical protein
MKTWVWKPNGKKETKTRNSRDINTSLNKKAVTKNLKIKTGIEKKR